MRISLILLATTLCVSLPGCDFAEARQSTPAAAALQSDSAGFVDTLHAARVSLERFRAELVPPPNMRLSGAARDRDELVRRFVEAARAADTAALRAMHMDRSEFAWIYFPGSLYASAPYELPPDYVWFHTLAESNKGAARAIQAMSGTVAYDGYRCAAHPERYGDAALWVGCTVKWRDVAGLEWDVRLFGSILEYAGEYKFVSFANRL